MNSEKTLEDIFSRYSSEVKRFKEEFLREVFKLIQRKNVELLTKNKTLNLRLAVIAVIRERYFSEMVLIYLLTFWETFLKEYLKRAVLLKQDLLKTQKKISHEEILNFNSMESLLTFIAEKEISPVINEGIDEIEKYFLNHFNLDLKKAFQKWEIINEAYHRRNIIVHNKSRTDKKYCQKTNYPKFGIQIITDMKYDLSLTEVILEFFDYVHGQLSKKLFK